MDGLFINYRREDSAPYAGRLYDFLRRAFPDHQVFMDIDAIDPGEDFVEAINKTLSLSRVVIAVIGPRWEQAVDEKGGRRLDDPEDFVYRELSAALASNARVIPVLVGNAKMPRADSLPMALQPLARRNAIEISDTRFVSDTERLSEAISRVVDPQAQDPKRPEVRKSRALLKRDGDESTNSVSLTTFKAILWTAYALGVIATYVQTMKRPEDERIYYLIYFVLLLGVAAWFNIVLVMGKNWARIAYLALSALSIPSIFIDFANQSGTEIAVNMVITVLSLWAIWMMFTNPVKQIFERRN